MKCENNAILCKHNLIQYMKDYLENKIDEDEYYSLSELCYSSYGDLLQREYPIFNKRFMATVPDACLIYLDEPGLDDDTRKKLFRNEIVKIYKELIDL